MDFSRLNLNNLILHDNQSGKWLWFDQPLDVFSSDRPDTVLSILRETEQVTRNQNKFAAGFISYEAAPAFDPDLSVKKSTGFPLIWFGIFEAPKIVDQPYSGRIKDPELRWQISLTKAEYLQNIGHIKNFIRDGETYQVNYTFRNTAEFDKDVNEFFKRFYANSIYGAMINLDGFAIASHSPELFFRLEGDKIFCRPMKGTARRGRFAEEDLQIRDALYHSEKDRAENVMIVDMIRNDLGKIAKAGTVKVPGLFEIEKYPAVWQMTSAVEANTKVSITDIFCALFPCASITGAPKKRTMEIINALESTARNIYTGTIGFIAPGRGAQFNVAIRTLLYDKKNKMLEYGTGSGIVWDSKPEEEYTESMLKVHSVTRKFADKNSFKLLETILWEKPTGFFLLEQHLERMKQSAEYFSFKFQQDEILASVHEAAKSLNGFRYKIRLMLKSDGEIRIETQPLPDHNQNGIPRVCFAKQEIDSQNILLYHKTTARKIYQSAHADFPALYDVILWNEKEEITESCFSNVIMVKNGKMFTPPQTCGLLKGVFLSHILQQKKIKQRIIKKDELKSAEKIYLVNSVRKWQQVQLVFD